MIINQIERQGKKDQGLVDMLYPYHKPNQYYLNKKSAKIESGTEIKFDKSLFMDDFAGENPEQLL